MIVNTPGFSTRCEACPSEGPLMRTKNGATIAAEETGWEVYFADKYMTWCPTCKHNKDKKPSDD